ncbi:MULTISPECIES: heptaprenyl diphosphate synthase component 1 [Bacillaceae]|uniref:heptaprenyl diphosphate synthase component 1 n=1 Tax=Bacillaceae TaxID=186817 RepID=UPI001C57425F|nr:heptaprenyl diphosphate synthase component 1 [Rossellomorea sp. YZS02]MBW3113323.1 heptaprenyl diphosphate synthase component 1 [Bacillus sp. MCCB 382]MDX8345546.1 heptaprenyl diphosphate synthase component 1 [Rossellomorea sp. YZS02]
MKFIDCNHQANIIHQYIEEQLHHSYLKEYIDQPYIDRDRIYFLLLPFVSEGRAISKEVVQWISTAMLLQIALDTHEKVTISERDPLKERQLTVLAGVYFSSLYYKILAETDDVELISNLAKAIKEINESKISIYKDEHKNLDELLKKLKTRESAIISNFFRFFEDDQWIEIAEDALLYKKLVQEKVSLRHSENTSFINAFSALSNHADQKESALHVTKDETGHLLTQIDELIERTKRSVQSQLETIEPVAPYFKKLIVELLPYVEPEPMTKLYAEEG